MSDNTPKMLTIREIASLGIMPEHALRRLVRDRRIAFIMVGNKALINYTALCEQLKRPDNFPKGGVSNG